MSFSLAATDQAKSQDSVTIAKAKASYWKTTSSLTTVRQLLGHHFEKMVTTAKGGFSLPFPLHGIIPVDLHPG